MSKQTELACFYVGKGYGSKVYEHDLEDNTSHDDDLIIAKQLNSWATYAAELVEIAHSITMEYPESHHKVIYQDFGEWFGERCDDNQEDGKYIPPDSDSCKAELNENVIIAFWNLCSKEQVNRLRKLREAV